MSQERSTESSKETFTERRRGAADRRRQTEDRRNSERVVDEVIPRRDTERAGRRKTD